MEVNPTAASGTHTASGVAEKKAMVDYDNFLQLLVAQMRNQDPTQPMSATDQIAQLATFSQVEQTIQTNQRLEMLLQSSALSEADAVIGRTLTSIDGETSGVVESVMIASNGIIAVLEGGEKVAVTPGVTLS
jgi:flagellar basal-body rod modification protein FlgD